MKSSIFSFLLLLLPLTVAASDSTSVSAYPADTLTGYDLRVHKYRKHWAKLIPSQSVVQYAGNMGLLSVGMGWDYGRRGQWETQLLVGYLPKHRSERAKMTFTLKQNFIPWSVYMGKGWALEPLSCGIYFNTIFGQQFWDNEPARYPDDYYPFLSTKVRLNVFVGQRVQFTIPSNQRKRLKSITAFYEVSACDLHIRSMVQDSHVGLRDILSLSLGLKLQMF